MAIFQAVDIAPEQPPLVYTRSPSYSLLLHRVEQRKSFHSYIVNVVQSFESN